MQVDCKLVMEKQSSVWCSSGIGLHKMPSPAEGPRHCFGFPMRRLQFYGSNAYDSDLLERMFKIKFKFPHPCLYIGSFSV